MNRQFGSREYTVGVMLGAACLALAMATSSWACRRGNGGEADDDRTQRARAAATRGGAGAGGALGDSARRSTTHRTLLKEATKMSKLTRMTSVLTVLMVAATLIGSGPARAAEDPAHVRDAAEALKALEGHTPAAGALARTAKGILVFPNIVKAGFLFGAQYGNGTLFRQGRAAGHYNIAAVSYGFQAGAQAFAYALFFMTDGALAYLDRSEGFEIGVGPSIVVVDEGMARTLTTTTARSDLYAFIFEQKGLMGGVGLQGSKITRIGP